MALNIELILLDEDDEENGQCSECEHENGENDGNEENDENEENEAKEDDEDEDPPSVSFGGENKDIFPGCTPAKCQDFYNIAIHFKLYCAANVNNDDYKVFSYIDILCLWCILLITREYYI